MEITLFSLIACFLFGMSLIVIGTAKSPPTMQLESYGQKKPWWEILFNLGMVVLYITTILEFIRLVSYLGFIKI